MITGKFILDIIPVFLEVIAIVLVFWSYRISLRMSIHMKYHNYYSSDKEQIIKREINQKFGKTIMHFIMFIILLGVLVYLAFLLLKNNVPLI